MANIGITLELDNKGYLTGIRSATDSTKQFGTTAQAEAGKADTAFSKLNSSTKTLSTQLGNLRNVIAGAAFLGFASSAIAMADAIKDLSDATGMSIANITAFRKTIAAFGGDADMADKAILSFYQNVDQAAQGSATAQESFARLGITLNDLATLDEQQLFRKSLEALAAMEPSAAKTALQMDVLGKAGRGLTINGEFINNIDSVAAKSESAAAAIRKAAELNDMWAESMSNLKLAFLEAFAPIIQGMSGILRDMPNMVAAFKVLGGVIITVFALTGIGAFLRLTLAVVKALGTVSTMTRGVLSTRILGAALGGAIGLGASKLMEGGPETDTADKKAKESSDNQQAAARKVIDALKAQKEAIIAIGDAYQLSSERGLKSIADDAKMVMMTDNQREAYKALGTVMKESEDTILKLLEKRDSANGKLIAEVDAEIQRVIQRRDIVIEATNAEINAKQSLVKIDADRKRSLEATADLQQKIKDIQDGYLMDTLTGIERQVAQIEAAERKAAQAALARFEIENRNLPTDEFLAKREEEAAKIEEIYNRNVKAQQDAAKQGYDLSRRFDTGWRKAFQEYVDNATNAARQAQNIFAKFTQGMEDLIVNFVKTGKFEFKDFVNMMAEELLRSQIQALFASTMQGMSGMMRPQQGQFGPMQNGGNMSQQGGGSSLLGGLLSGGASLLGSAAKGIGDFFGGFFADGGNLGAGKWGIAGENGPELIRGPASVTPMGGGNVTYNINAVDAASFKALVAADPGFIHAVATMGGKSVPRRR